MARSVLPAALIGVAGVAILGGYYIMTRPEPLVAPPPPAPETGAETATDEAAPPERVSVVEGDEPGPYMTLQLAGQAQGSLVIDLFEQHAPGHVAQIRALAEAGAYDGVVFHRVIPGFMAQTGDVEFGQGDGDLSRAGMGGSDRPDLAAEFSDIPFDRGIVGMARSQNPDSANSQFFIMFDEGHFLNGQYTVIGKVVSGMGVVDAIKPGSGDNGQVRETPDRMVSVTIAE